MNIIEFDTIESTSDFIKENYQILKDFTFVRADLQTKGRGQFDRIWESKKGLNLLFSLLLKNVSIDNINDIKDTIIKTLVNYLKRIGLNVSFKEPNDLYIRNLKLAGILIETRVSNKSFDYIIIGIGININQVTFPNLEATSLKRELNKEFDIAAVFKEIINDLKINIESIL